MGSAFDISISIRDNAAKCSCVCSLSAFSRISLAVRSRISCSILSIRTTIASLSVAICSSPPISANTAHAHKPLSKMSHPVWNLPPLNVQDKSLPPISFATSSQPRFRASIAALNKVSVIWKFSTNVTVSWSSGIKVKVAINQRACFRIFCCVGTSHAGAFDTANSISVMPLIQWIISNVN